jgi:hypothetical protein
MACRKRCVRNLGGPAGSHQKMGRITEPEGIGGCCPEILSQEQKAIIAKFLKYMVLVAGDNFVDAIVASRAYEHHWAKYEKEA